MTTVFVLMMFMTGPTVTPMAGGVLIFPTMNMCKIGIVINKARWRKKRRKLTALGYTNMYFACRSTIWPLKK